MARVVRFVLPIVLCIAIGIWAGQLLRFDGLQQGVLASSLCLFVIWLFSALGSEPYPVLSSPSVGTAISCLLATCVWLGFFYAPTGWLVGTAMLPHPPMRLGEEPAHVPRVLSMLVCVFPAIPYGVSSLAGLVSRFGG